MRKSLLIPDAMICLLWKAVCVEMRLYSLRRGQRKRAAKAPRRCPTSFGGGRSKKGCLSILPGKYRQVGGQTAPRRPPTLQHSGKQAHKDRKLRLPSDIIPVFEDYIEQNSVND